MVPAFLRCIDMYRYQDGLRSALEPLSVTHVFLNHTIDHYRASRSYTPQVERVICAQARRRAADFAQSVPDLRWVGIRVRVQGGPTWLYSWRLDRRSERALDVTRTNPPLHPVTLTEMDEDAGWEVLRRQGMHDLAA